MLLLLSLILVVCHSKPVMLVIDRNLDVARAYESNYSSSSSCGGVQATANLLDRWAYRISNISAPAAAKGTIKR